MATAYSFLLGLISREELSSVEEFEIEEPALDEEELLVKSAEGTLDASPAIDPGFQKAVARGRLTMEEAVRRGDRTVYADNLSRRYDLTMDLAFAVTDNRITLFQARKREEARPRPDMQIATPSAGGAGKRLAVLSIVAVAILGISWGVSQRESAPRSQTESTLAKHSPAKPTPTGASPTYSSTEVLTDTRGRVTQVIGLDPRTVLLAYCGSENGSATCDPLEIMDTVPPSREVRLGTFRHPESPDTVRAISIQRNRFSRRWVAGDGEQPIPLTDAKL